MCNGEFYDKGPSEAFDFFDQLAENTKQWETSLPFHVESSVAMSRSHKLITPSLKHTR